MEHKIRDRIEILEKEILKYKKTTVIALVFSILCGGGGLVGLASWLGSLPKTNIEIDKIQVETQKLALEIIKDSLEISMQKFDKFQSKHNSEIESIARQLELNQSLGNTEQANALITLLINKEQQFQNLISTTSEMCRRLSEQIGSQQWTSEYIDRMQSIKQESFKYQKQLEGLR